MNVNSRKSVEEKLHECERKLEELERLKLVEQSVIAGLEEGGFSDKAIELFRYRKNFLLPDDSLKDEPDIVGSFTGACGDHVEMYLTIDQDIIKDAKFLTDGCPGAVTSASALTGLAMGKDIEEAEKLSVKSVVEYLKEGSRGLPKSMYDCCGIAVGSLRNAIKKYKNVKKFRKKL